MNQYKEVIKEIFQYGITRKDRTEVGTTGILGSFSRYLLSEVGKMIMPLVTSKKTNFESIKKELLWFIRGETNIKTLDSKIWDEWADKEGELGPIYGKQWRFWEDTKIIPQNLLETYEGRGYTCLGNLDSGYVVRRRVDQLQAAINLLRTDPDSRRIIVSSWNPGDLEDMALPPCHCFFQFFSETVQGERFLTCLLYQRSADVFLGVPFNIASYALLTHLVAQITNHQPKELIHVTGDTHLYRNHLNLARDLLRLPTYPLATLEIVPKLEIDDFKEEDINLIDYQSGPFIKAQVAI